MITYIGCKVIQAEPMTRGEYNDYMGFANQKGGNPADEGYVVKYPDGYISWSPKAVFEEAYSKVGDNPLFDTAISMRSKDYKERFIAEYKQLVIRYKGLTAMLEKWDKNELTFVPTCPRSTYNLQIKAMTEYIAVLEARAVMEGIKLQEV